jgi:hypothetical protein
MFWIVTRIHGLEGSGPFGVEAVATEGRETPPMKREEGSTGM